MIKAMKYNIRAHRLDGLGREILNLVTGVRIPVGLLPAAAGFVTNRKT